MGSPTRREPPIAGAAGSRSHRSLWRACEHDRVSRKYTSIAAGFDRSAINDAFTYSSM